MTDTKKSLSEELRDYVELVAFANETVVPDTLEAWADRAAALEAEVKFQVSEQQRANAYAVETTARCENLTDKLRVAEADIEAAQGKLAKQTFECAKLTVQLRAVEAPVRGIKGVDDGR